MMSIVKRQILLCRETMTVYQGDIVVVQYNLVQQLLLNEEVRLI
jgi:hypothetical protein